MKTDKKEMLNHESESLYILKSNGISYNPHESFSSNMFDELNGLELIGLIWSL
jgi:hypothetical protein